ncbi:MAG: hypothetical protein EXX96DRAFT_539604 [Benjaminiella poitrasii]|nr:MAG: hypothetical protein EXX96DRAFT_539604 [Benjaminiella poitrasii]
MDFIHYNPATKPFLVVESSSDEIDLEDIAIQNGDLEMIIDFDIATEVNAIEMEDIVDSLTVQLEEAFLDDNKQRYKKYDIITDPKTCCISFDTMVSFLIIYQLSVDQF